MAMGSEMDQELDTGPQIGHTLPLGTTAKPSGEQAAKIHQRHL